jgi:hypothetical protein
VSRPHSAKRFMHIAAGHLLLDRADTCAPVSRPYSAKCFPHILGAAQGRHVRVSPIQREALPARR